MKNRSEGGIYGLRRGGDKDGDGGGGGGGDHGGNVGGPAVEEEVGGNELERRAGTGA